MKRHGNQIILGILILGIILYFVGGVRVHHGSSKNEEQIANNVAILQSLEEKPLPELEQRTIGGAANLDMEAEKAKIIALKGSDFDRAQLIRWYDGVVVVGDSMVEASYDYEWLNRQIVYGKIGVSVSGSTDLIDAAMVNNPAAMVLCFGINDIEGYGSEVELFINNYREQLQHIRSQLPDTAIYINCIFPPRPGLEDTKTFYKNLDLYNQKLQELCSEQQVSFVDASFLLTEMPDLFDQDGVHPKSGFYPLWYTFLADVMGLTEDGQN